MKCGFLFILLFSSHLFAQQSLLLFGGGQRNPEALKKWMQSSSAIQPQVMIITWASSIQSEVQTAIEQDFKKIGVHNFLSSQSINSKNKSRFLSDLKYATHIFFSGGDQKRIMAVVKDREILNALENTYWVQAIPVAGTSAGTAAQAELMIQGDDLPLAAGLGFLPDSVTDQHFFKRHREARLRAALDQAPDYFIGVGVDEDGAILFSKNPRTHQFTGKVFGEKSVMSILPKFNGSRQEVILTSQ